VHRWTNRNNEGSREISAESKFFQVRRMCKIGGEARAEEKDISQVLDLRELGNS
jgi:hypothetical protein